MKLEVGKSYRTRDVIEGLDKALLSLVGKEQFSWTMLEMQVKGRSGHILKIVEAARKYHEQNKPPEQEFDWADVKAGMAFNHRYADKEDDLYFYVGKSCNAKETIICYRKSKDDYGNYLPEYLTRSPENDIEV